MMSGAMPNAASAYGAMLRKANISTPRPSDSHSAWRNSGAISPRRFAPSSCETEAVSEISVPIGTIIGSHNSAVPTVTAASVAVAWWPAITLSTKPIRPVETWPSTSGSASVAVARTSWPKRGVGEGDTDMGINRRTTVARFRAGTGSREAGILPARHLRHPNAP